MEDSDKLFDWLRFYGALIGLLVFLGAAAGLTYRELVPRQKESAVIVVAEPGRFAPNQFQLLAAAVFRSSQVYQPVVRRLGITMSPERFFSELATLSPIPDTTAVIITAKSSSEQTGLTLATAMTQSFIAAFEDRTGARLETFGSPTTTLRPVGLSTKVAVALGALVGLWLALALATLHYRVTQPILSLNAALTVTRAARVEIIRGNGWPWLGVLRPVYHQSGLTEFSAQYSGAGIVIAHAGTPERDLLMNRAVRRFPNGLKLLWGR